MEKSILIYQTPDGKEPFWNWLFSLRDIKTRHRIEARIDRLRHGNYGDHKRFCGILELRLDFGKGYRIYCGEERNRLVILLIGGNKSSQQKDIKKAMECWRNYNEKK